MNKKLSEFAARLRGFISPSKSAFRASQFDAMALELFVLQFKYNSVYRKISENRKATPSSVEHWTQVPFVPTATFKDLELTTLSPDERTTVFHSSGTTEQKPSRHFHCAESLAVYETSLWNWFDRNILKGELIILTPTPKLAPNSSLVHMFEIIRQKIDAPENVFFGKISADGTWALDFDAAIVALGKTQAPKLMLGTAFSYVHLLDFIAERSLQFQLPPGSRVMETGGYKNRSRSMPKAELHSLVTQFLGVPEENILCEYGMSELSSQAYAGAGGRFQFPPWARVQIVSPETGREVAEGETGLIRIFDLANVFSVAAIQTEDVGIRRGEGFELLGRSKSAEPRGCSLNSPESSN